MSEGPKVVDLTGRPVEPAPPPIPGAPNMAVVKVLTDMLNEAIAGNLRSVAAAGVRRDGTVTLLMAIPQNFLIPMTGASALLHKSVLDDLDAATSCRTEP